MNELLIQEKLDKIINLLNDQGDKPMSINNAVKYLGITRSQIYKYTSLRIIPHYKPNGKLIYFKKSELDSWVFKNKISTGENK